jgi:hypothetical protein
MDSKYTTLIMFAVIVAFALVTATAVDLPQAQALKHHGPSHHTNKGLGCGRQCDDPHVRDDVEINIDNR